MVETLFDAKEKVRTVSLSDLGWVTETLALETILMGLQWDSTNCDELLRLQMRLYSGSSSTKECLKSTFGWLDDACQRANCNKRLSPYNCRFYSTVPIQGRSRDETAVSAESRLAQLAKHCKRLVGIVFSLLQTSSNQNQRSCHLAALFRRQKRRLKPQNGAPQGHCPSGAWSKWHTGATGMVNVYGDPCWTGSFPNSKWVFEAEAQRTSMLNICPTNSPLPQLHFWWQTETKDLFIPAWHGQARYVAAIRAITGP